MGANVSCGPWLGVLAHRRAVLCGCAERIGTELERLDLIEPVTVVAAECHGRDVAAAGERVDVRFRDLPTVGEPSAVSSRPVMRPPPRPYAP